MRSNDKIETVARIAPPGVMLAALLAMMFAGAGIDRVQAGAAKSSTPAASPAQAPAKGAHESIGIHGHWTIDVKNPDGTQARHVEFENGLCIGGAGNIDGGDIVLANLLVGAYATGGWEIRLGTPSLPTGANPGPACFVDPGSETQFVLEQSNDAYSTSNACSLLTPASGFSVYCFPNLAPPTPLSSPSTLTPLSAATVSLTGQFIVPAGVGSPQITSVGTFVNACQNTSGAACLPVNNIIAQFQVTGAYLTGVAPMPAAITVVAGQSVSVNVQLSFH